MGNRWCAGCKQDHGPLYLCPSYPEDVQAEIIEGQRKYRANLTDPAWLKRQMDNGVPGFVLLVFQAMAGIGQKERNHDE